MAVSLGTAGLVALPPRETRGDDAGRSLASHAPVVDSVAAPGGAPVQPTMTTSERRRYFDARGRTRSIAVGRATRGFLRHAVGLDDSPTLLVKPSSADQRFGTYEVVAALRAAAESVAAAYPGSRMTVGDLSRRGGGRIRPHRSHRRGLDADVGFFLSDAAGAPITSRAFVRMDDAGLDVDGTGIRFDVARNWALVVALLEQPHARVQYLIIARPLEQLLLAYATSIDAPPEHVASAEAALYQSSRGARHDNHFHVRFYCAADDRPACVDSPPYHPWFHDGRLRAPDGDEAPAEDVEAKR